MLGRIDDWLIDRAAQPVADRLAHWTTPQALSRSLMIGSAVFICCRAMVKFTTGTLDGSGAVMSGIAAACNLFTASVMPRDARAGWQRIGGDPSRVLGHEHVHGIHVPRCLPQHAAAAPR